MDTSNTDNIYIEPKTPRRSIRLKVTASTPLLNASLPSEVFLRRSVRKQKTKTNKSLCDSNSGKNIRKQAQTTLDINKKKKQKKGKKSLKNYESKSEESESTENDSDKKLLNVTFDKDSSSNSDCGEVNVLKLSSIGEKSVKYFKEREISSFRYNNTKLGPLADTYGFRNEGENTFLNQENDINAAQQIIFEKKSSSNIVVATDKFDQSTLNKDGNSSSSVDLGVAQEGVNVEINTSLDLDNSDTRLLNIESSKMQIHNSLTPVSKRAGTITPRSKILQSGNSKDSKRFLKKSLSNRICTPFRRNNSVEKIIGESKPLNVSVVQTLLRSDIVTPVHVLKTGEQFRSIRKRSFSESAKEKRTNRVTFHSPSNVEIKIEDYDETMEKAKEEKSSQDKVNNIYVTERRKRSLSVAETQSERKNVFTKLELEPDEECTPAKLEKLPPPGSRGKMPNFNAIHQQKFHKMESIAEHIARKAERAKFLTSSTAKYNTGSIIKPMLTKGDGKKQMEPKIFSTNTKKISSKTLTIPKARQRIELSYVENIDNQKTENSVGHVKSLPKSSTLTEPTVNKLKSRQQKNMELYKGRPQINQKTKRQEIVKGVRSNRRFELQMMCRNRSDHN